MIYNIRQPVYQQQTQQQPQPPPPSLPSVLQPQLSGPDSTMKSNGGLSLVEKIIIGIDHAPPAFNLREQLLGVGNANLQYIRKETGVNITLRGIGSLFIEPNLGTESQEPLHFHIEHQRYENLNSAKQLAKNLIETLQQEFLQFQQQQHQAPTMSQINMPPPSIINVPPPSIIQSNVQTPTNIIHQQFVTPTGIPIQMQQGNMVLQQQPTTHNLSVPPPVKQIVQFHQPPPTIQTSSAALTQQQSTTGGLILNHQPQASIQYQYIQQPARDAQGNQITFQQMYQQSPQIQSIQMQATLPPPNIQQQQQYIVQGNTAYMMPPPTIIQQTAGQPTHLSIIQHPPPLHMQLPAGSITVQAPITETIQPIEQAPLKSELTGENEEYSTEKSEESEQHPAEEDNNSPTSESDAIRTVTTTLPPPHQQIGRQPLPPPMTHVPPPTITMSVPPPMNGVHQHIVGNTLYTTTATNPSGIQQFQQQVIPLQQQQQTQQFIHTAPNGQNYVMDAATTQWQARAAPPTQYVTQQITGDIHGLPPPAVSMNGIPSAAAASQTPVAVTFSQPMMQQQLQVQFQPQVVPQVQMQTAQPPPQQFNIIQTQQPPPPQAMLQQPQQQQQQPTMGVINVSQNGLNFSQPVTAVPPTFVQQPPQTQIRPPQMFGEQQVIRPGQKRKSTSDPTDAPPLMQPRIGVGTQRELVDYTIAPPPPPPPPPPPTTSNSNLTSIVGVGIGQDNGSDPVAITSISSSEASSTISQAHGMQNQKTTGGHPAYVGMMRYNSDVRGPMPPRPHYSLGPPPSRGRMMFNGNYNMRAPQHDGNYRMNFGPPQYRGENPGQTMNYGPRRMQR